MKKLFCDLCAKESENLVIINLGYTHTSSNKDENSKNYTSCQFAKWELCYNCSDETHKTLERSRKNK